MTDFKHFGRKSGRPKDPRRLLIQQKGYGQDWPKQRAGALKRDNYTCQYCGYVGKQKRDKSGRFRWDVAVHHKVKIRSFADTQTGIVDYAAANDLSNLITCCDNCHKYRDGHANNSGFKQLK